VSYTPGVGSHPLNLGLRFVLELCALGAMGRWGYHGATGVLRYLFALGVPLLAATAWGVFAVPADPSRSGQAPVAVPGIVRLLLELAFFGFATWALARTDHARLAWIFGLIVALHYALSYDRIAWLLRQ
jgi:hypothetical protein